MGRPSRYTKTLGEDICKRLIEGESLRAICEAPDMPSVQAVMGWLLWGEEGKRGYATFLEQYIRARNLQADVIFDRLADTAADETIDVQRARLIVDTEKWRLGRMKPKKYGTDRIEHAGDKDAPLNVTWNVHTIKPGDDD